MNNEQKFVFQIALLKHYAVAREKENQFKPITGKQSIWTDLKRNNDKKIARSKTNENKFASIQEEEDNEDEGILKSEIDLSLMEPKQIKKDYDMAIAEDSSGNFPCIPRTQKKLQLT